MNNITLGDAVARYKAAIATLESGAEKLSAEQILEVLIARDAVQAEIADKTRPNPGHLIREVNELDKRLKQRAESVNWSEPLTDLQSIFNPPKKDWWWLLDPITPKPWRDRYDWLWRFISLIFLTASLSLLVEISTRFLSGGPDTAGILAVVIPSVLTLLASGGALTKPGQEGIEYILISLKINKHLWDEFICLVSGLIFGGLLLFWLLLPYFADSYYVKSGNAAYEERQFIIAENNYNRALKLDPRNREVYYKLGYLYGELDDFDKAIENLKIAFKGGKTEVADDIARSYLEEKDYTKADKWLRKALAEQIIRSTNRQSYIINNKQYTTLKTLVRIYLDNADYANAFRWLSIGLGGTMGDTKKQYTMLTYHGWVLLNQERYSEAKNYLRNAISLPSQQASAHCLLAQVLQKSNQQEGVYAEWEQCLKYGNQNDSDEYNWITLANKYFQTKKQ